MGNKGCLQTKTGQESGSEQREEERRRWLEPFWLSHEGVWERRVRVEGAGWRVDAVTMTNPFTQLAVFVTWGGVWVTFGSDSAGNGYGSEEPLPQSEPI